MARSLPKRYHGSEVLLQSERRSGDKNKAPVFRSSRGARCRHEGAAGFPYATKTQKEKAQMKKALLFAGLVTLSLGLPMAALADESQEKAASTSELRVDINTADVKELTKLPGLGEQMAKRIVAYREENGPFEKAEELMNVRGIGEKSFLKLQPHLTVGSDKEKKKK
jgi:competence protein ComEA